MFQIGDFVLVRRTYELLQVKAIQTWGGKTLYLCGREGTEDPRSYAEVELSNPIGTPPSRPPTN
jgi:hypothetical protein